MNTVKETLISAALVLAGTTPSYAQSNTWRRLVVAMDVR